MKKVTQSSPKVKKPQSRQVAVEPGRRVPTVQRATGLGPPIIDFMPIEAALSLQQLLGNKAVLGLLNLDEPMLDEEAIEEEQTNSDEAKAAFTPEVIDQIVSDMIAEQLEKYNNIPVTIKEEVPIVGAQGSLGSAAEQAEAAPAGETANQDQSAQAPQQTKTVTKKVKVRAVYFINREVGKVKVARKAAGFSQIADEIDDQLSELMGGSNETGYHRLSAGRAVEIGKATPEDLGLFMNKAIERGELHRYGQEQGILKESDQLVGLSEETVGKLIQDWMYATGVGVDCSGFINIALVRAREKIRDDMRAAGVPEEDLPRSLARMQRPQLDKDKEVTNPTDLRPGDVWVTNKKSHVRVVMEAHETVDGSGRSVIEFATAESTTTGATGPADKTWHTGSLKSITTIKNVAGGGPKDGNFYRIKRAI